MSSQHTVGAFGNRTQSIGESKGRVKRAISLRVKMLKCNSCVDVTLVMKFKNWPFGLHERRHSDTPLTVGVAGALDIVCRLIVYVSTFWVAFSHILAAVSSKYAKLTFRHTLT